MSFDWRTDGADKPIQRTKKKVYLNRKPVGVLSYKKVVKVNGISYITYNTEKEILDRLSSIELEEDGFDKMWKEHDKKMNVTKLLLSENKTV